MEAATHLPLVFHADFFPFSLGDVFSEWVFLTSPIAEDMCKHLSGV